jgi:alpha-tubulin suppressor-like RCC1 family protein
VGENHLLALTEQKLLVGWGDNSKGQLAIPAGVTCWDEVVSGNNHVIAIDCAGTVYAWGDNTKGQTTIPTLAKEHITERTQLVAYGDHTVLMYQVEPTYELVRWGANPNDLPTIRTDIQYMVAGVNHALAIISDSTVIAWGDNSEGQSTVPSTLTDVYSIANGTYHSMAIDSIGTIWAWGSNKSGQLNIPANLGHVVDITAGRDFSIAYSITDTGAVDNNGNPLLTNLVTLWGGNSKKTLPMSDLNNIMSIKCYDNHCVAMIAGSVVVNGSTISQNYLVDWVYTNDTTGAKTVTIRKPPNPDYRYINYAVGGSHTLVVQSYDHIDSNTGDMTYNTKVVGFLNPGASNVGQTAEQTIPSDSDVSMIAAGATHSVLLTTDDKLTIWGSNSANERITPNYIAHVMGIVAGSNYNLAIAFVDRSRLPNTATATRTATVSKTATATRSATRTRSNTLTRTNTSTMTATHTRTITRTPTATRTKTSTLTASKTSTATVTRTNTSTMTATRTRTITRTPTSTRTKTSTLTASKTSTATATRTATKTATPSRTPRP